MELVDAHCHFDFPVFDGTRSEVWQEAREAGVERMVIPGVRAADWGRVRQVAGESESWWYCLGIHPWFVEEHNDRDLAALQESLRQAPDRCVAVGECGLDRLRGDLDAQMPWFEAQVKLAGTLRLPLVIHSVRTHDEVFAVLRRMRPGVPALIHGFSGSYQQAKKLVGLGCYLGVGGVITYDRAHKTRETIRRMPLDCLVLESDAPDMPPAGVEKGANEPARLGQILTSLAQLLDVPADELAPALTANACRFYGWRTPAGEG